MAVDTVGLVPPINATRAKPRASSAAWTSVVRGTMTSGDQCGWSPQSYTASSPPGIWPPSGSGLAPSLFVPAVE